MTQEKISATLVNRAFPIGQTIYIPQKNRGALEVKVLGWHAVMLKRDGSEELYAIVQEYDIGEYVFVRRGDCLDTTNTVLRSECYDDRTKAQKASEFLKVELNKKAWKLAIGDRNIRDKSSPYHLENCNLHPCCAEISAIRDILLYCRENGGLIVHERDELVRLMQQHGFRHNKQSPMNPLRMIFEQLGIDYDEAKSQAVAKSTD